MRTVLLLGLFVSSAQAGDWMQFRGAGMGQVPAVTHPLKWDAETNIAWSVEMAGSGWSSPIVVGDRIFVTAAEAADGSRPKGMMAGVASMGTYRNAKPVEHQFTVSCLSLQDGSQLWKQTVASAVPPVVHPSNTYATESPASDGSHLFTFFATTGTVTAWDLDGKKLWQQDVGTYSTGNGFGTASSLAVGDGMVFVQSDNDEDSFVVAFRTTDGKQIWKQSRESRTSWASPFLWSHNDGQELITCGSGTVTAYDPKTGSVIWQVSGVESSFSSSPAVDGGRMMFGNSGPGSAGPLVAIDAGLTGKVELNKDFEAEQLAWSRTKSGPGMASPVTCQGRLYIPGSGGMLSVYDVGSGERVYRTRISGMKTVAASLWADQERVFILDEAGNTFIIAGGDEYQLLDTNRIEDLFWSTPAIVDDALLLRGVNRLYCVRKS